MKSQEINKSYTELRNKNAITLGKARKAANAINGKQIDAHNERIWNDYLCK